MFGKLKDDKDQPSTAVQQPQPSAETKAAGRVSADQISSISRSMTVVGKIVDDGTVHVFGQIEGELRALSILIEEGAKVEGDLVAEELTIGGMVKGTIHANRVRLNSAAVVEGDIFHRSLSIEENARFEGLSKREDNARDVPRTLLQQPASLGEVEAKSTAVKDNSKSNGASSHDESHGVEAS
ncbi:MAG: polymer-forming cytoskeletal protein [Xanthobacteraceae bacterium]